MSKTVRRVLVLGIAVVVVALPMLMLRAQYGRDRASLAAYKTGLRARGEKLTFEELGYPRPPESSSHLDLLVAGVNKIASAPFDPGLLELVHFVRPGRAEVAWTRPQLPVIAATAGRSNAASWEAFCGQLDSAADAVQELRQAVEDPPRYFYNDLTDLSNLPKAPFVELRKAAQWLMGDAIAALHAGQNERGRQDVHALIQLAQFHREDLSLLSQMVRTAIASLALATTWEALQAQDWSEEKLVALQKDWEAVDLVDAFEKGMVGNRAYGEAAITQLRASSPRQRWTCFKSGLFAGGNGGGTPPASPSAEDYFARFVWLPLWAANSEADEMFLLQHHQKALDSIRSLRNGTPMLEVSRQLRANVDASLAVIANPLTRYRHLFSAICIPNYIRAGSSCIRNETQRRLTITAIALERYRQRTGILPAELDALMPASLSAMPIDPMSARPLRYQLHSDRSFTLYSVGEDGRDDGGDARHPTVTNRLDLWEGRDAVWPVAVRN